MMFKFIHTRYGDVWKQITNIQDEIDAEFDAVGWVLCWFMVMACLKTSTLGITVIVTSNIYS